MTLFFKAISASLIFITACSAAEDKASPAVDWSAATIEDAVASEFRTDEEKSRDVWRHPVETLNFFEIQPSDTVVEIWPGGGWYSNILVPYLATGNGQLIAAHWDVENLEGEQRDRLGKVISDYMAHYDSSASLTGIVSLSTFSATTDMLAEPNSVDAVLTFRNLHNWMAGDYAAKFFDDAYAALRPGGVLGIVEHRLPSSEEQNPRATSGYVHEDFVRSLAAAAGFEAAGESEINANPDDTADHPFGVWTLPPVSRSSDRDGNTPDGFDPAQYLAIGESDRMTMKFVKPLASDSTD
ncbi:MAG: hypothetical protein CME93_00775 [Hyphomonadaceae bacterium]|nr:hypothetical protein [Hyphomonadaceae bacterium]OUX95651.1 MAG: hypothetical protein CBB77_00515 [Hyphomonas sp. TMED17]CAI8355546.1 MAG: Uncharacterised protein [Hyphomonas sp. TMED17]